MSDKKTATKKENLNWKINYLAAQVGETTHMKTALIAASRAKQQVMHSNDAGYLDQEALRQELHNARKLKLETKLHQARKDIKGALKKGKQAETQKQNKKIKSARKLLEENPEESKEDAESKPKKKITAKDVEQYEKELEVLKNIDLDTLVEKTLRNKLQKDANLKGEDLVKELIESHLTAKKTEDQVAQNIESRIISNKAVAEEIALTLSAFQHIIKGNTDKLEEKKAKEAKKKLAEEKKKRKAEEEAKKPHVKKPRVKAGESEFVETLGELTDDENEDENFQKIYEGVKKPNRAGQRQRRKQWEEKYGREANHIASEFKKREEKRLADPNYRPKKKPAPVHKPVSKPIHSAPAEPVHPSWEAKRMQEEMISKALSGKGGPSNNKIVFDDSD